MPTNRVADVAFVAPAWTRLLGLVGSACFVVLGYFLVTHPANHGIFGLKALVAGWLSIIVFGVFGLLYAVQLIPRFRDRVIVTRDGFMTSRLLRLKQYAWSDIAGPFAVWQQRRTKHVVFNTATGKGNLTRVVSGHDGYLPVHLGISAEGLAALMNQHLEAARARLAVPPRQSADIPRRFGRKGL